MTNDDQILNSNTNMHDETSPDRESDSLNNTENTIDLDSALAGDLGDLDDVTFEEDNETRENTRPDAMAKIAKLKNEIEKLKAEKQQYLDSWQRDKAEFINARKRDEESKAEYIKFAYVGLFEDLLPVIDSFESALKHEENAGITLIYNQFKSFLKKYNIESIGMVGEMFDPAYHQAIGNTPLTEGAVDHTISEVLQLGYKTEGKIIRPALVKVFQA